MALVATFIALPLFGSCGRPFPDMDDAIDPEVGIGSTMYCEGNTTLTRTCTFHNLCYDGQNLLFHIAENLTEGACFRRNRSARARARRRDGPRRARRHAPPGCGAHEFGRLRVVSQVTDQGPRLWHELQVHCAVDQAADVPFLPWPSAVPSRLPWIPRRAVLVVAQLAAEERSRMHLARLIRETTYTLCWTTTWACLR